MRLMLLTPEEKEMIALRREKTEYFRHSGDESTYMLSPCIILGENGNFEKKVDIPEYFTIRDDNGSNRYGSFLALEEMGAIHAIQKALEIREMETGLFYSLSTNAKPYSTEIGKVRMKNLELVELTEHTLKVIRRRPLKRH